MMKSAQITFLLALPLVTASAAVQDDLFDGSAVHELRIDMQAEDWRQLRTKYLDNTFYRATLRWRGETVANAGIRSRGNDSRNSVKPGLRIDFDKFDKNQRFLGLASVVLDNGVQDPSLMKERLAMQFFGRMNRPAPRAAHARVYVNGEPAGLYVLLDRLDTTFLRRHFASDKGDFYEFNRTGTYRFEYLGDDPAKYAANFEAKNSNPDTAALVAMIRTANQASDSDFFGAMAEFLDYRRFAEYLAIENYIAEMDGFVGEFGMNNFYLYRDPATRRFEFIPWDKDFSFHAVDYDIRANLDTNVLTRRYMKEPRFQEAYYTALARAAAEGDQWLESQATAMRDQVRDDATNDPGQACPEREGCIVRAFEPASDYLIDLVRNRSAWVIAALPK